MAPRLRGNSRGAESLNLRGGGGQRTQMCHPTKPEVLQTVGQPPRGSPGADLREGRPVLPAATRVMRKRPKPWELGKRVKPILKGSGPGEKGSGQAGTRHGPGRSRGGGISGWGSYKHGSRRGSAARFPSWVILLPAAAPTVPGPAAPSTAATNAAAILHWPAAATTTASALCACACAATLSGPFATLCWRRLREEWSRELSAPNPPRRTHRGRGLKSTENGARGACAGLRRESCFRSFAGGSLSS